MHGACYFSIESSARFLFVGFLSIKACWLMNDEGFELKERINLPTTDSP